MKLQVGEPITANCRVLKLGQAYYLNLPPEFVERNDIGPGQRITHGGRPHSEGSPTS